MALSQTLSQVESEVFFRFVVLPSAVFLLQVGVLEEKGSRALSSLSIKLPAGGGGAVGVCFGAPMGILRVILRVILRTLQCP